MATKPCACKGNSLDRLLRPAIMGLLAHRPMHGYVLLQELRHLRMFGCQSPDPTGVYRTLRLMEEEGMLTAAWDLADSGPARRRYRMTKSGRACLATWIKTLENYRASIDQLLKTLRAPAPHAGTAH
jgi:PadR family transcriptional regulator, regulatory protein PadR